MNTKQARKPRAPKADPTTIVEGINEATRDGKSRPIGESFERLHTDHDPGGPELFKRLCDTADEYMNDRSDPWADVVARLLIMITGAAAITTDPQQYMARVAVVAALGGKVPVLIDHVNGLQVMMNATQGLAGVLVGLHDESKDDLVTRGEHYVQDLFWNLAALQHEAQTARAIFKDEAPCERGS